jgi:hypothetical protein
MLPSAIGAALAAAGAQAQASPELLEGLDHMERYVTEVLRRV